MTREQRIEAAARALMSDWGSIDVPTEREIAYAFDRAKAVLTAAFPELMSYPPTEQPEDAAPTILHTGLVWATPHTKEQT